MPFVVTGVLRAVRGRAYGSPPGAHCSREADSLKTIPGFGGVVAAGWPGAIGPALHEHFATADRLASRATACPGNYMSAKKSTGPGFLVVLFSEQGQRHHEIHHDVRRKLAALPLRGFPRYLDRLIDRVPRRPGRQQPP